jgi:hypothetical protein
MRDLDVALAAVAAADEATHAALLGMALRIAGQG